MHILENWDEDLGQTEAVAMRQKMDLQLPSHPAAPQYTKMYTDDIFIIWTHRKESLEKFYQVFNNFHPSINLLWTTPLSKFISCTLLGKFAVPISLPH